MQVTAETGIFSCVGGAANTKTGPEPQVLHTVRWQAGGDLDQRPAKPGSAGCADRELEAVASKNEAWSHHAAHPVTRLERPADEVGFAEHAVQVQVETGNVVPRAEAEAGSEDAGVSLRVDDRDVGRVAGSVRSRA